MITGFILGFLLGSAMIHRYRLFRWLARYFEYREYPKAELIEELRKRGLIE